MIQDLQLKARDRLIKFTLDLDPNNSSDVFVWQEMRNGTCYETETALALLHILEPGDRVIDVGANIGFFSILMSRLVGDKGKVIACEPSDENIPKLQLNKKLNEPGSLNIEIERRPIWYRDAVVTFWHNSDHSSSSALINPAHWEGNVKSAANPRPEDMRAITIDGMKAGDRFAPVKLIKIDVEGAELHVLQGARETLIATRPPYVITELNPLGMEQLKYDTEYMRLFMRQFGYDLFFLHGNGALPTLIPPATQVEYVNGIQVKNAMFSTVPAVAKAWPKAFE